MSTPTYQMLIVDQKTGYQVALVDVPGSGFDAIEDIMPIVGQPNSDVKTMARQDFGNKFENVFPDLVKKVEKAFEQAKPPQPKDSAPKAKNKTDKIGFIKAENIVVININL